MWFLLIVKVVEFAEYGHIKESQHTFTTVERLWKFTIQAATALEHLEKKKVIHKSIMAFHFFIVADYQVTNSTVLQITMLFS